MRPGRLSLRLALGFAIASLLLLGSAGLLALRALEGELARRDDEALRGRLERMRDLLGDAGSIAALQRRPQLYANMLGNRDSLLWVLDASGRVLIEVNPAGLPPPAMSPAAGVQWRSVSGPPPYRLAWCTEGAGADRLQLVAGRLLTEREQVLAAYRDQLLILLALGSLLAFGLGAAVAAQGLRPVRRLAEQVGAIDTPARAQHLRSGSSATEVQQLEQSLNQMLDRLAQGFQRLSGFAGDLAHELRTPLHNLMLQTQAALQRPEDQQLPALLAAQLEEFERLTRLVNGLLFLARAEQPEGLLQRETVDLAALAKQLADYFEGPAAERGLQVRTAVSGQLQADPALLRQALANLIANAIRHGAPDGELWLRSTQRDGELLLSVWNAGPPIDAVHLPQLFERFYRADASRRSSSGSGDSGGLGLAIVRSIARLHGGEVSVRSDVDGTEFTLNLPLR